MNKYSFPTLLLLSFFISYFIHPQIGISQTLEKEQIAQLKYRHVGPVGNRIIAVAGIPGDPLTYYVGAATGGIWKSIDGGIAWKPIFDDKPVHAIGALAIAPSDSEIIYAGTGESFIRSNVSLGNGMWKSMDGGDTWEQIGLEKTGRISRIVVHPDNPCLLYTSPSPRDRTRSRMPSSA